MNEKKPLWPVASLAVLTGLNLLDYLDRQLLAAVLPPLQAELHLGDEQAGTIGTAFMLGYFLTSPIFGYLGDRWPRRWLIAAGVFVWSLGTLLSGHAHSFAMLILFRVLVGFGEASGQVGRLAFTRLGENPSAPAMQRGKHPPGGGARRPDITRSRPTQKNSHATVAR